MSVKKLRNLAIVSLIFAIVFMLLSSAVLGIRLYVQFWLTKGKTGLGPALTALVWAEIIMYLYIASLIWFVVNISLYIFVYIKLDKYKESKFHILAAIGFIMPLFQIIALSFYISKLTKLAKEPVVSTPDFNQTEPTVLN